MTRPVILFALLFFVLTARAHSPLSSTAPTNGAVVDSVPLAVSLTFKRLFRLTRVTSTVADTPAEKLDISHIDDFARSFELPLVSKGAGTYRIEWRGLGEDGHVQKGHFSFTVQ